MCSTCKSLSRAEIEAGTQTVSRSENPFATFTADYRDLDLVAGFSPSQQSFVAIDLSFGNGILSLLEHRQQYKLNGQRIYKTGNHRLTLLGLGYYGFSYIPGLVPIFAGSSMGAAFATQIHSIGLGLKDLSRNPRWMAGEQSAYNSELIRQE